MKLWHILGGITLSALFTGAALAAVQNNTGMTAAPGAAVTTQLAQPAVTGTVTLHDRIALPSNAALTVTVSDASVPDVPSRVITQSVAWIDGMQAPYNFTLPYNPADIQPNARILLSAAVTLNNQVIMTAQDIQPVITNGVTTGNLTLIPVESVALPTKHSAGSDATSATKPLTGSPGM